MELLIVPGVTGWAQVNGRDKILFTKSRDGTMVREQQIVSIRFENNFSNYQKYNFTKRNISR